MLKYDLINEDKEDMCLEIYGVRYYKLTTIERERIDKMYISKYELKGGSRWK